MNAEIDVVVRVAALVVAAAVLRAPRRPRPAGTRPARRATGRRQASSSMLSAARPSPPAACGDRRRARPRPGVACSSAAPRSTSCASDRGRWRHELVELAAREQRRVDLEVRVLGGRADQRDQARLDRRQQRVLLRLVEAVDLVQEEDRAPAVGRPAARAPRSSTRAHVGHAGLHRRELHELGCRWRGRRSAPAWSCRCPAAPKKIIDGTRSAAIARRSAALGPDQVRLALELVEALRAQPLGQRRRRRERAVGRIREQVASHRRSLYSTP